MRAVGILRIDRHRARRGCFRSPCSSTASTTMRDSTRQILFPSPSPEMSFTRPKRMGRRREISWFKPTCTLRLRWWAEGIWKPGTGDGAQAPSPAEARSRIGKMTVRCCTGPPPLRRIRLPLHRRPRARERPRLPPMPCNRPKRATPIVQRYAAASPNRFNPMFPFPAPARSRSHPPPPQPVPPTIMFCWP